MRPPLQSAQSPDSSDSPNVLSHPDNDSADAGAAAPTALLVLGMHRSGTSALTRTLSLLGAQLPDHLIPPRPANEAGFWESVDIQTLNDRVLQSLGASWDHCWELDTGALSPTARARFRDEALALLQRDFGGAALFVLKDPRLCRLLPLWLEVFEAFGAQPRCVLPLRNPLEVAESLNRRNGFSTNRGLLLWLRHVLDAEAASRGLPRAFCNYDALLSDWRGVTDNISARLGLPFPRAAGEAAADIDAFLSPRLRHHAADPDAADARLTAWVREVADAMHQLSLATPEDGAEPAAALARMDAVRDELARATQMLAPLFNEAEAGHSALAEQREHKLQQQLEGEQRRRSATAAEHKAQLRHIAQERQQEAKQRDAQQRALETALRRRDALLAVQRGTTTRALKERDALLRRSYGAWFRRDGRGMAALVLPTAGVLRQYRKSPRALLRLQRQARQVVRAGLFDPVWYLHRYGDIAGSGAHPLWHWMTVGWREGRAPNALFDCAHYLHLHTDVAEAGINPLLHYLQCGAAEGRSAGPLFDAGFYLAALGDTQPEAQAADLASAAQNPLAHCLTRGMALGLNPNAWFDADWYVQRYPDVASCPVPSLWHFLLTGAAEGRVPGPDFDDSWYLESYADVARSGANALKHFLTTGLEEGRALLVHERVAPDSERAAALQVTDAQRERAREVLAQASIGQFSIVMPTWNRRDIIDRAIASVQAQSFDDWELIICDDGSSDGTAEHLQSRYETELASGKLRLLTLPHGGVCAARNAGLDAAQGRWIAYLDSDNAWHPDYLLMTAAGYAEEPERRTAYACLHVRDEAQQREFIRCRPFDWDRLLARNYIDLNVFSHHRELVAQHGGFDPTLRRLVDWDLILRYTQHFAPRFNALVLCDYYIGHTLNNITLTVSMGSNEAAIRRKFANARRESAQQPEARRAAPVPYADFESFERRSLFTQEIAAPFSEEARRVIGHMHGVRRHLAQRFATQTEPELEPELVSVILALAKNNDADDKNSAAAAEATVRSVLAQHYRRLELIVVGRGADRLATQFDDARLRYVDDGDAAKRSDAAAGIAAARNRGLRQARGEYVVFLDAHCALHPDYLRILSGTLRGAEASASGSADIAYCAHAVLGEDSSNATVDAVAAGKGGDEMLSAVRYVHFWRSLLENRPCIDLRCCLFRRSAIDPNDGFDEAMPALSDWAFMLRATETTAPEAVPALLLVTQGDDATASCNPQAEHQALTRLDAALGSERLAAQLPGHDVPGLDAMFAPRARPAPTAAAAAAAKTRKGISVVIPSFECPEYLRLCVDSVRRFSTAPHEIIIVDNASSKSVRTYLAELRDAPDTQVVLNESNLGFTHAVNQGISAARDGNDIVLLNNDAVVTPGWDDAMQQALEEHPDAGLVIPRQALLAGTRTMQTHNPACDTSREMDVNLSLHHDNVLRRLPGAAGIMELRFAPFFCVYIPRHTINEIGLLDHENAPHYRSDRLYCEAVRRIAGRSIIYTPHSKLYHFLQQATVSLQQRDAEGFQAMFVRNDWAGVRGEQSR